MEYSKFLAGGDRRPEIRQEVPGDVYMNYKFKDNVNQYSDCLSNVRVGIYEEKVIKPLYRATF